MAKIAVMGYYDSIYGFAALGLETYPVDSQEQGKKLLRQLAERDYAVIYMTEALAQQLAAEVSRYRTAMTPAIILIPGREGSLGIGKSNIQSAIERAVGADIL